MKKYKFQDGGDIIGMLNSMREQPEDTSDEDEQVDNTDEETSEDMSDDTLDSPYNDLLFSSNNLTDYMDEDTESMDMINMVLNGDSHTSSTSNSSIGWLTKKDNSVNLSGTSSKLSQYLNSLPPDIKQELVATSGNDSDVHMKNSKHDTGKALDLRFSQNVYNYMVNDPLFKQMGLHIPNPNHGTAPHIHLEEREFGGDGGEYINNNIEGRDTTNIPEAIMKLIREKNKNKPPEPKINVLDDINAINKGINKGLTQQQRDSIANTFNRKAYEYQINSMNYYTIPNNKNVIVKNEK